MRELQSSKISQCCSLLQRLLSSLQLEAKIPNKSSPKERPARMPEFSWRYIFKQPPKLKFHSGRKMIFTATTSHIVLLQSIQVHWPWPSLTHFNFIFLDSELHAYLRCGDHLSPDSDLFNLAILGAQSLLKWLQLRYQIFEKLSSLCLVLGVWYVSNGPDRIFPFLLLAHLLGRFGTVLPAKEARNLSHLGVL